MSNSITKIVIQRNSNNGLWNMLSIEVYRGENSSSELFIGNHRGSRLRFRNEDEAISYLLDRQMSNSSELLRSKIVQGFQQMRIGVFYGNIQDTRVINVEEQIEPHTSCKKNEIEDSTNQTLEANEISQSLVQQQLAIVNKDSEVMKFLDENKCSVCLSSYKEVLDNNFHIVIPSCGHPLCCECADNILKSTKKECPRCRGNVTAISFNLMMFNADLQMVTQDQRVLL